MSNVFPSPRAQPRSLSPVSDPDDSPRKSHPSQPAPPVDINPPGPGTTSFPLVNSGSSGIRDLTSPVLPGNPPPTCLLGSGNQDAPPAHPYSLPAGPGPSLPWPYPMSWWPPLPPPMNLSMPQGAECITGQLYPTQLAGAFGHPMLARPKQGLLTSTVSQPSKSTHSGRGQHQQQLSTSAQHMASVAVESEGTALDLQQVSSGRTPKDRGHMAHPGNYFPAPASPSLDYGGQSDVSYPAYFPGPLSPSPSQCTDTGEREETDEDRPESEPHGHRDLMRAILKTAESTYPDLLTDKHKSRKKRSTGGFWSKASNSKQDTTHACFKRSSMVKECIDIAFDNATEHRFGVGRSRNPPLPSKKCKYAPFLEDEGLPLSYALQNTVQNLRSRGNSYREQSEEQRRMLYHEVLARRSLNATSFADSAVSLLYTMLVARDDEGQCSWKQDVDINTFIQTLQALHESQEHQADLASHQLATNILDRRQKVVLPNNFLPDHVADTLMKSPMDPSRLFSESAMEKALKDAESAASSRHSLKQAILFTKERYAGRSPQPGPSQSTKHHGMHHQQRKSSAGSSYNSSRHPTIRGSRGKNRRNFPQAQAPQSQQ